MSFTFKKALVTGGAGFIGSHLVEALVAGKCRVTVLDNLSSGSPLNLEPLIDRITFYQGDIRQRDILEKAAEGCDVIFHLAAWWPYSKPSTILSNRQRLMISVP